ncbi:MAG: RNase P subunit p30 family protein [Candidatus Thorarchaeota archaeon]
MGLVDLSVRIESMDLLDRFTLMARSLRISGFATTCPLDTPITFRDNVSVYARTNLQLRSIDELRVQARRARERSVVVAIALGTRQTVAWAATDPNVDLITVDPYARECIMHRPVARLAADNDKLLEIQIQPLLKTTGLERSRILKTLRSNLETAVEVGMKPVISSNASTPTQMRSSAALRFIGKLLSSDEELLQCAVDELPNETVRRNLDRHL